MARLLTQSYRTRAVRVDRMSESIQWSLPLLGGGVGTGKGQGWGAENLANMGILEVQRNASENEIGMNLESV